MPIIEGRGQSWHCWTLVFEDKRTQQAVVMRLVIMGKPRPTLMIRYAEFAAHHSQVPWRRMHGMRNRIAHGYFDINLEIVWEAVQRAYRHC
ncbi:hypothetical protein AWM79_02830 [Pseudomonas agarici]|uniref:DUF86 domain-containing protein n=1 Tax=Pseudomonas agarici TaxID=46677 RepID=A0A0X1SWM3_PSEAA|nr:hypothetical protein AWM79_02830 [Pseudomonas agarici]NWB89481.1 DUF86 domain-containing protein [Pseudomonas agarici]NWC10458.1 DUF86 domain-containing protein [Pseudomonas agarici]